MKVFTVVKLLVQPVGPIDRGLLRWLTEELESRFPIALRARYSLWPLSMDYSRVFDWARMQFNALAVNQVIHETFKDMVKPRESLVVGLVAGDGYVEGLNFVFGLATPELSVATVYTSRLESRDVALYQARVLKEVMHEVGHLLGLNHCGNRRCVMSFSNSVAEVDAKEAWFCPACTAKLKSLSGSI